MGLISYAQNLEDIVLWRALKDVEAGYYIDIGAYDPAEDSVTKLFYDLGWQGINVEPVKECYERFCEARPRDINLNIAIAEKPCLLTLHKITDTGISTAAADIAAHHKQAGRLIEPIEIPALSLRELMGEAKGKEIHFLKIDVEGLEEAVLKGGDFSKMRPWIIVVESTAPGTQTQTHHSWCSLLEEAAYKFVYFDGLNRFYLAEEQRELESRFESPPNLFDDYTTMREIRIHTELSQVKSQLEKTSATYLEVTQNYQTEIDALRQQMKEAAAFELERIERSHQAYMQAREKIWAEECLENQRLSEKLNDSEEKVAALISRLSTAEERYEALHKQNETLGKQNKELHETRERVVAHNGNISIIVEKKEAQIKELSVAFHNISDQLVLAHQQIHTLLLSRSAFLSSKSWRMTAPLRKVKTALQVLYRNPAMFVSLLIKNLVPKTRLPQDRSTAYLTDFPPIPSYSSIIPNDDSSTASLINAPLEIIDSSYSKLNNMGSCNPFRLLFNERCDELRQAIKR